MDIQWTIADFNQLSPAQLYAILQLRNEVFVVEQQCAYQDADNKDMHCRHLMGWQHEKLVAYTRLVPPGISYPEPSIGRVVTSPTARGGGLGRMLMQRSIDAVQELYPGMPIRIGAQYYLLAFYTSLGFMQAGDIYLEDNIEHINMVKAGENSNENGSGIDLI